MDILYFVLAFIIGFIASYAINSRIREGKGLQKRGEWEFLAIFVGTIIISYIVLVVVVLVVSAVITSIGN